MTTNELPSAAEHIARKAAHSGRSDIHRPQVFDPEQYDYSHAGTWSSDEFLADVRKEAARMLRLRLAEGYTIARHQSSGQCGHCGARLTHYAAMLHVESKEIIYVGETCLGNRFEMATREFQAWRKMRAGANARNAKAARLAATLENHPALEGLRFYSVMSTDPLGQGRDDFLISLANQLFERGELSEKQIAAAERALARVAEREAKKAEEAEAMTNVPAMTEGRRLISGTIISKKWKDSPFGYGSSGAWKIVIRDAEGYRYYGTLPGAASELDRDSHIQIVASIKPSDDDPHFGFFSRPTLKG